MEHKSIVPSCCRSKPAILQYRSTRHSRLRPRTSIFRQALLPSSQSKPLQQAISVGVSSAPYLRKPYTRKALSLTNTDKATNHELTASPPSYPSTVEQKDLLMYSYRRQGTIATITAVRCGFRSRSVAIRCTMPSGHPSDKPDYYLQKYYMHTCTSHTPPPQEPQQSNHIPTL